MRVEKRGLHVGITMGATFSNISVSSTIGQTRVGGEGAVARALGSWVWCVVTLITHIHMYVWQPPLIIVAPHTHGVGAIARSWGGVMIYHHNVVLRWPSEAWCNA